MSFKYDGFNNELYIVTIKIKQQEDHNPFNKLTGLCVSSDRCTDWTGGHHCFLVTALNEKDAKNKVQNKFAGLHITRIELAKYI